MSGVRRAQSEVVGVVLLLGLTIVVTGATVAIGSDAISSTQQQAATINAENVMTLFDAKASLVALGSTDRQTIGLGTPTQGRYEVHPDRGWITLTRYNETENGIESTKILSRSPLGVVEYTGGQTQIAYQGGGVWRSNGDSSILVSPPEFHYQDQTLTLPVISVMTATGGTVGTQSATVTPNAVDVPVYPNETQKWDNPVSGTNLTLTVHSRYAEGWAQYFETRTGANATVSGDNVTVDLSTVGDQGRMSLVDQSIEIRGMDDGHALTTLNLSVKSGNNQFAPGQFGLRAGSEDFTVSIGEGNRPGNGKGNIECDGTLPVTIAYSGGSQTWTGNYSCTEYENSKSNPRLNLDLTSNRTLTYQSDTPVTFNEHDVDGDRTFSEGDTASSSYVIQHYIALLRTDGSVDITVQRPGNGNGKGQVQLDQSFANVKYNASDQVVTYLHVSKNNVTVALD